MLPQVAPPSEVVLTVLAPPFEQVSVYREKGGGIAYRQYVLPA